MPLIDDGIGEDCFCIDDVGGEGCDPRPGIAKVWYQAPNQFIDVVTKSTANGCCDNGTIESFNMKIVGPSPATGELLHTMRYIPSDTDESAVLGENFTNDGGTPSTTNSFTLQMRANRANDMCWLRKNKNREVVILLALKDGRYVLVGYGGGIRISAYEYDTTRYMANVTFSGRPVNPFMEVEASWAKANIIPYDAGTGTGLIRA